MNSSIRSKDKEPYGNKNAQFLCVMNGGWLVQHCDNHAIMYTHEITNGDEIYSITSTHHQMQYPYNLPKTAYDLLYVSKDIRSRVHEGEDINPHKIYEHGEPEIVLYHQPECPVCLAIQGHPEMMNKDSITITMLNNLLEEVINNK